MPLTKGINKKRLAPAWNKTVKLYLPSTFQTSDIELLSIKIET